MMKWHSFPEAIYSIHYAFEGLNTEFSVETLLVDARTFLAVEDFAKATCPDGWMVTSIEKAYYDYSKMYGGDDGRWIDIKLNEGDRKNPVEFLGYNLHIKLLQEENNTFNAEVVLKRKQHLRKVNDLYEANRSAHSRKA